MALNGSMHFFLRLDHRDRSAVAIEQHVVDETLRRVFEVRAEIKIRRKGLLFRPVLADDLFTPALRIGQKPPARPPPRAC